MDTGEKIDKILGSVIRTETKVEAIESWQKKQEKNCRQDMGHVWRVISGDGGHGERLSVVETNQKSMLKKGMQGGAIVVGGGGVITFIVWLLEAVFGR